LGSITGAVITSLQSAGIVALGNLVARQEGREALGELWRRLTGDKPEEVIGEMTNEQRTKLLETLLEASKSVQSSK
jgi:hypothetical protein